MLTLYNNVLFVDISFHDWVNYSLTNVNELNLKVKCYHNSKRTTTIDTNGNW